MTSLAADTPAPAAPVNRAMMLASVMLATALVMLDTTIANVALPHMAGTVSASQDQIGWVLTSYIIAAAICTPLTGWLSDRFGRKRVLIASVAGFISASALCGAAQNLEQMVLFRLIQGALGAPLMPLSQALVLDMYPPRERGPVMALWGMAMMVSPIIGPVLGGWLTDTWSWRWVFYINLPVGLLCLLGTMTFVPRDAGNRHRPFDLFGFVMLSIAIGALQLGLDRGQGRDWFQSPEIVAEAAIFAIALWFSLVHSVNTEHSFLPLKIFRDLNFLTAAMLAVMVGMVVMAAATLVPLMLQNVYGYSVLDAGLLSAPRGVGSLISMLVVGRLTGKIDDRFMLMFGQLIFALTFLHTAHFTLDTSPEEIALNGFIQGWGTGFVFLPLTNMAYATLAPSMRGDATAFFNLLRNLGSSAGISMVLALLTFFAVLSRSSLVLPYSPDNTAVGASLLPPLYSLTDPAGIAALSAAVDRQASMQAFTQVYHTIFLIALIALPAPLLMRRPKHAPAPSDTPVHVD